MKDKTQFSVALAQFGPRVGDFEWNTAQIAAFYQEACQKGAHLLMTPELSLCGYPPGDLVFRPEMRTLTNSSLKVLLKLTHGKSCALVVGHVGQSRAGKSATNQVSVLLDGKIIFEQAKSLLPTYDVFDEERYFEKASEIQPWEYQGLQIGIAICEDLWASTVPHYPNDPVDSFQRLKVDLLLSVSASPFDKEKAVTRLQVHQEISKKLSAPLIYVNQIGAVDEIIFDGGSFAFDAKGEVILSAPQFEAGLFLTFPFQKPILDLPRSLSHSSQKEIAKLDESLETLLSALTVGIREYFDRTGFKRALIGLSGGIDSAVVAVLAKLALGEKNVIGVGMPSPFSSSASLTDASALAKGLGIHFEIKPIKFSYSVLSRELSENREPLNPIALENLQSRLRGLTLMTLSNHENALVIGTGNKSELAVGYCTLYGDLIGALSPIGDLYKTEVYQLAAFINRKFGSLIPVNSLERPPSAELRPNQLDQDSLPPYDFLDAALKEYLENQAAMVDLEIKYPGSSEILKRVERNEFKRRQAPFVLKVSSKSFGSGRKVPIAKKC